MTASPRLDPAWIRVVGDLHGHAGALRDVLRRASADAIGLMLLGDLVNRGPDSPGVVETVLAGLAQGVLDFVPGNNDVKLARAALGRDVRPSADLDRTLAQFAAREGGNELLRAFARAVMTRPAWRVDGPYVMAHAGFDLRMLHRAPAPLGGACALDRRLAAQAIWGEVNDTHDDSKPEPSYAWARQIPPGHKVLIGHDVRAHDRIVRRRTDNGGEIIHLDCGLDEGGRLATLDVPLRRSPPRPADGRLWITDNLPPPDTHPVDAILVDGRDGLAAARTRARAHLARGADVLLAGDHHTIRARLESYALVSPDAPIVHVTDQTVEEEGDEITAHDARPGLERRPPIASNKTGQKQLTHPISSVRGTA